MQPESTIQAASSFTAAGLTTAAAAFALFFDAEFGAINASEYSAALI
jgi:hypothetical protein